MKIFLTILLTVMAIASISCEKDRSGVADIQLFPPFLNAIGINTTYIHIDTTSSGAVTHLSNGKYKLTFTLTAYVSDSHGLNDIKQVSCRIYSPMSHDVIQSADLSIVHDSSTTDIAMYKGNVSFTIERSSTGNYIIEAYAVGSGNVSGNSRELNLLVEKNSGPPHLWNLSAQDTFVRPLHGRTPVFFRVSASDPDGLADIDQVYFRNLSSTNSNNKNLLYDDGNFYSDGDSVAGDGRYATLLQVDSSNTLGSKLLRFYAIDKSGFLGDSLDHTIIIIAQ